MNQFDHILGMMEDIAFVYSLLTPAVVAPDGIPADIPRPVARGALRAAAGSCLPLIRQPLPREPAEETAGQQDDGEDTEREGIPDDVRSAFRSHFLPFGFRA